MGLSKLLNSELLNSADCLTARKTAREKGTKDLSWSPVAPKGLKVARESTCYLTYGVINLSSDRVCPHVHIEITPELVRFKSPNTLIKLNLLDKPRWTTKKNRRVNWRRLKLFILMNSRVRPSPTSFVYLPTMTSDVV